MLSYAPKSPDGTWPCEEVRNVLEDLSNSKIENGLVIGKSNQRGVVCRGPGGGQERELVDNYTSLAEKVRAHWPRTARVLDSLVRHYETEAKYWDDLKKQSEFE
jgi:hypothetical protein